MPAWLHRTDKRLLNSIAEADLPEPVVNYIEEPDMSAVAGEPSKYWIITGDVITLMDQTARDALDAAEDTAQLDAISDELDQARTIMRAFAEVMLDQVNALRADHGRAALTLAQLKTAVRGKL
jgi:hypothetical protein